MAKGKVKEALDAAASFKARGIKKAALNVVAEYESKKKAAICRTCHRGPTDPADAASPADYAKNPKAYCPECKTPNLKGNASFKVHGPKTAAPGDPNQPIQRDEPAAQADPPVPAPEAQPVQPVAPAPEPEEVEESQEAKVARWREELESTLDDDDLITAVLEFFEAENADLDDYGVKVTDGYFSGSANIEGVTREGYVVCKSDDDAEAAAIAQVTQDLENEPELFTQSWLESYINTERLANDLSSDVEEQVRESPDSYGWDKDEYYETEDFETYTDSEGNVVEDPDEVSEDWITAKAEELLKDPVAYMQEIYGEADGIKQAIAIAGFDVAEAAADAVAADGWQHFLSRYDGDSYDLPSGGVYFRD